MKRILAIPGSLRAGSTNHNILKYLGALVSADVDYSIYNNLALIPPFDPGNDDDYPPEPVFELRELLKQADGIIICTPEYAFGVPGQLKNMLDWTVSSGSFSEKPVALITASLGGEAAHAAMLLILGALNAQVADGAKLNISFIRSKMDGKGNVADNDTLQSLNVVLETFLSRI
ncbi:NADPH-dependent FMN reductase [Mucilaginibacter sp. OK283]|jgi:NAD(P)H-dependent FMN reductase|uniref:NADPH-dependent FMN reductase n=1 Tax=Mucilaginibacter sp. OK283 TaxID=1881049 RepID=UPI0008BC35CA|nr:NADPH-dependent FMN reductase [Mucilaginibacter sp. OK283]SEP41046.1 NAD(P)H-dependent FMN reductase [Mucilaginibacter sp. OK283]